MTYKTYDWLRSVLLGIGTIVALKICVALVIGLGAIGFILMLPILVVTLILGYATFMNSYLNYEAYHSKRK